MNPFQAIAFTLRSFIQSRRLQQETGSLANTWYESEDERYADEVGDLIAADFANIRIDTKRRTLIFKKGRRLDLHGSLKRLQRRHPDVDPDVMESEMLYWVEQTSEPEGDGLGWTQEEMDEHNQRVEDWFDDYHREVAERAEMAENP
jgi:hypothetical protein